MHLLKTEKGVLSGERKGKKIIVSLTTYPKRFHVVHLSIETLLNQTLKPDKIILWLSKEEVHHNEIPRHIQKLTNRGLEIKLVPGNLKSYKKLLYSLQEYPNDLIVTVDDDVLYPDFLIEGLYRKYLENQECVTAYRCSFMKTNDEGKLSPYLSWKPARECFKPSYRLFPTGVGGILYPPKSLYQEVFNESLFTKLAPTADDVWFKAMALLNNTKTVQVYENCIEYPLIDGSQEEALWKINNGENQNDRQLKEVFDFFDLYRYIEKDEI